MKTNGILAPIIKSANKIGFWAKRKSPELLIVGGIIAAGGAIVLAIKSTLKLEDTMKTSNENIKEIKDKMIDEEKIANGVYDIRLLKKDLTKEYAKSALKVGKLYLPTALAFTTSISAFLGSHKIMKGRGVALAAAYTTLENGYKSYRERVARKFGEKAESEIFRNVYDEEKEVIITGKDGKEKVVTKKVKTPHVDSDSDFTYLFDASNPDWSKSPRLNVDFLLGKERYLNQKLIAKGYLFLHEIYEDLGVEPGLIGEKKTQASRILGWIYDPTDDTRDNYISFGIADKEGNLNEDTMEQIRNGERDFLLEFNPDGDILTGSSNNKTFVKYAKVM